MAQTETAALPLALPATAARSFHIPRRPLKLGIAASLAFAGAYGLLSEQQYVISSNAIVSAYVLDIRSPIDGTLTGLPHAAGQFLRVGDPLGHLENPVADHQHLDNLRTLEDVAASTADADQTEAGALEHQRLLLIARADAHTVAVTQRLTSSVAEAESTLAAAQAQATEAATELRRGTELHRDGILPTADFDKLVAQEAIARRTADAQRSALGSLRAQTEAAGRGLLAEPGINNDVAYSRQRADELSIKLAETQRSLAASRAQARLASASVLTEQTRSAQLRATDLRSPIAGQLWEIQSMDGERAAAGDQLLSLVDCTRQFLLVEVPQDRLPDIAIGQPARFRFTGETRQRTGLVLAVTGDPQKEPNHKFAAFPIQDPSLQLATVRVAIDPDSQPGPSGTTQPTPDSCAVGRTARVLLPTLPTNFVSRLFRTYF